MEIFGEVVEFLSNIQMAKHRIKCRKLLSQPFLHLSKGFQKWYCIFFAESTNVFYFGVLTVKFQNKELKYVRSVTFCES